MRGIGIYVGRKHVVAALAVRSGHSVQLQKYGIELIPEALLAEESSALLKKVKATPESQAIQRALEKIGCKNSFAAVAMSPFHVITRHFIMPALPEKEKADAIRYEASRFTKLKLTESVCVYRENIAVNNSISVSANAVKKRMIESLVMNLRRGQVEPATIEPDYVPYSRVCQYFGFNDYKSPHAMIWMDSDHSVNVTLVANGIVFFSQDFRLSGDEAKDRSKFSDELSGAFRYLRENAGGIQPENIFLAGFGSLDAWGDHARETFPAMEVSVLRPPVQAEDSFGAGAAVIAFGLALGELGLKAPMGEVSLLPIENKKMRPKHFASLFGLTVAAVGALFFLIYFIIQVPLIGSLEKKKKWMEKPLSEFGAAAAQSIEDLEFQAMQFQMRFDNLEQFEKSKVSLKDIFVASVAELPKSLWLQSVTVENNLPKVKVARLIIRGYCFLGDADKESKQINDWAQSLARNVSFTKNFGHLAVDEMKQEKILGRSMTHFIITAEA